MEAQLSIFSRVVTFVAWVSAGNTEIKKNPLEDRLFFYLKLLSRVRTIYNEINQLADFKFTVIFKKSLY